MFYEKTIFLTIKHCLKINTLNNYIYLHPYILFIDRYFHSCIRILCPKICILESKTQALIETYVTSQDTVLHSGLANFQQVWAPCYSEKKPQCQTQQVSQAHEYDKGLIKQKPEVLNACLNRCVDLQGAGYACDEIRDGLTKTAAFTLHTHTNAWCPCFFFVFGSEVH